MSNFFKSKILDKSLAIFIFLKNKTENKNSTLEMIIKNTFELEI